MQVTDKDYLLALTTICFDIAGLEMFLPLVCGATLHIATREQAADPEELAGVIAAAQPSIMQATPTTWRMLLRNGWAGAPNMHGLCGGEALPSELMESLLPKLKSLRNVYGPTETTVWSTMWRCVAGEKVQIGKPIWKTTVRSLAKFLVACTSWLPLHRTYDGYCRCTSWMTS
jgi:non-ribosomal peptide synthetase component F